MNKDVTKRLSFYAWCFFACSFVGWIYESAWKTIINKAFTSSGFLYGCYVPIYGFGGLLLIFALKKLMEKKSGGSIAKKILKPIVMYLLIMILVSGLEYIVSVIMELVFNDRWWDYSYDVVNIGGRVIPLNINGRVSLRNSAILAALGFVFVYLVYSFLKWLCAKVNVTALRVVAGAIVAVMGADFVVTVINRVM